MKNFLVINLSNFGDVLLTNALCQSIKLEFPDSKVYFLLNEPFYEAAKYMKDVDEVLCFDKKGKHKGFWGLLKFVFSCKFKNFDTALIMYGNDRGILISWLLMAKVRISGKNGILRIFLTHHKLDFTDCPHTQDGNANFLQPVIGKKTESLPIKYFPPESKYIEKFLEEYNYNEIPGELIGLCPLSSSIHKDLPLNIAAELINTLSSRNSTVYVTGSGERIKNYINELKKSGCDSFIDFSNKTSIAQLGYLIQKCNKYISVDTGAMHMACAVNTPLIALFYDISNLSKWAPKEFYNHILMTENITAQNIVNNLEKL